jgi:uncharacterized protein (TIGR02646 family)
MKNLDKKPTPQFFIDDTAGLTNWNDYYGSKKRNLREYILKEEQSYVCVYCEVQLEASNTNCHLEHIRPKESASYPELTFEYSNLGVSCNGNHCNPDGVTSKILCGPKKDNFFDEDLFLHPFETPEVSSHFAFNSDGEISPVDEAEKFSKAEYMIELLNLNGYNGVSRALAEKRKNAFDGLFDALIEKQSSGIEANDFINDILEDDSQQFVTFLRFVLPEFVD